MHYAVTIFPTGDAIHPAQLGAELEARGFESLWVAEHSHIPASRKSPWPGGAELPQMYYETMDPFVALTAAATATERLKVGTGIALVIQRDPIHTAKEVASLDHLSGGRFLFGIGAGWNIEEMEDHGTDPSRRFGLMRESVEAMKAIWTEDQAEYHGEQIDFDPMFAWPKPTQKPHPPIHVGGVFPGGLKRAVRYADGWMPIAGRGESQVDVWMKELRAECGRAGRDPSEIELSVYMAPESEAGLVEFAELGVARAIWVLPPAGADVILPRLDALAALIESTS